MTWDNGRCMAHRNKKVNDRCPRRIVKGNFCHYHQDSEYSLELLSHIRRSDWRKIKISLNLSKSDVIKELDVSKAVVKVTDHINTKQTIELDKKWDIGLFGI